MKNIVFIVMIFIGLSFMVDGFLKIANHEEIPTIENNEIKPKTNKPDKDPFLLEKTSLYAKSTVESSGIVNDKGEELEEPIIKEYYIQLGTFQYEYFAYRLKNKLKEKGYTVVVTPKTIKGKKMFINSLGPFKTMEIANKSSENILKLFPDLKRIPVYTKIK